VNCDQAFECLTDPFHAGQPELEQHLAGCPRCRQMQETLEPALGLFAEEHHSWETEADECFSQDAGPAEFLSPSIIRLADHAALQLQRQTKPVRTQRKILTKAACCVALVLFGAAISYGVLAVQDEPQKPSVPGQIIAEDVPCLWLSPEKVVVTEQTRSRDVVLSCLVCHVGTSSSN